jgi:hypothetical protein
MNDIKGRCWQYIRHDSHLQLLESSMSGTSLREFPADFP